MQVEAVSEQKVLGTAGASFSKLAVYLEADAAAGAMVVTTATQHT